MTYSDSTVGRYSVANDGRYPVSQDTYNKASPEQRQHLVMRDTQFTPKLINNSDMTEGAWRESEAEFATTVEEYLHLKGYKYAHFRPGMTSRTYTNKVGKTKNVWVTPVSGDGEGFEDYFVWHEDKRLYFLLEIKSDSGKLSAKQKQVIESHQKAGLIVYVVRPRDFEWFTTMIY